MTSIRAILTPVVGIIGCAFVAALGVAQTPKDAANQKAPTLHMIPWYDAIAKLEQVEGYYTYKGKDAVVEVLGSKVVDPTNVVLVAGRVQFRLCNGVEMAVDSSDLRPTTRRCGKSGGTWLQKIGDSLVPILGDDGTTPGKILTGKKIDLSTFPAQYQSIFAKAKNGELVGYSTQSGSGDLTLTVLTKKKM